MPDTPRRIWYSIELPGDDQTRVHLRSQRPEVDAATLLDAFPGQLRAHGNFRAVVDLFEADPGSVDQLLTFMRDSIRIGTQEPEIWAKEPHYDDEGRTETGSLLYRAKPYTGLGDPKAATQLAHAIADHFSRHPSIRHADAVVAVPDYSPRKPYSLPAVLASRLAAVLDCAHATNLIAKVRDTPPMKDCPVADRQAAMRGAFRGVGSASGRRVVVIDDVVESGSTIRAAAAAAREAGAREVIGIAATAAGNPWSRT
jgi:hypothetical protein